MGLDTNRRGESRQASNRCGAFSFSFASAIVIPQLPSIRQFSHRVPKGVRRLCKDRKGLTERRGHLRDLPRGRDVGDVVTGLDLAPGRDRSAFPHPPTTSALPFVPGNSSDLSKSSHRSSSLFAVGRPPASSTVDPLHG